MKPTDSFLPALAGLTLMAQTTALRAENSGRDTPSVAILHGIHGSSKNMHHDEFDFALDRLGWSREKFTSTKEGMDRLAANLSAYDLAAVCPLFNYGQGDAKVDMPGYGPAFRAFVEGGGALIVTDALYPEMLAWLTSIDPSLRVGAVSRQTSQDVQSARPEHPLRFLPNRVRENNTWGHLTLPEGHGWEVIATCGDDAPQAVVKRLGKGYVYVTGCRLDAPEFFENFIANLRLQRIGLTATAFGLPPFNTGTNAFNISFAGISSIDYRVSVRRPSVIKGMESEGAASSPLPPDAPKRIDATIPFDIAERGDLCVTLEVGKAGEKRVTILDRAVTIKDLLNVSGPRYRGFAVESDLKKRDGKIFPVVELNPHHERLKDLTLTVRVEDAQGKALGKADIKKVEKTRFLAPVATGAPKPGDYTIVCELYEKGKRIETKTAPLTVLTDADCPVYINDDMNLVVDGNAFFTLGIYHVNPDDMALAAGLGFNTVQMWSWFADKAFTEPAKHGMKVLYEQNHRGGGGEWVGKTAAELADKFPNALLWYGLDEPSAVMFNAAKKLNDTYHAWDKRHPTFTVSCTPALFAPQTAFGDIFAVDPYPVPNRPITMVSDWMDAAWAATGGDRPVFCVPQCFGTETPETLRAMSYLAVTHEARGIIWYPWDDGGKSGLKHHPALHPAMKQIVSEMKALSPALLNKEGRRQFKSADGKIHGLYCQESPKRRYMVLVNTEATEQALDLRPLDGLKGAKALKEIFTNATLNLSGNASLTLGPYEVRVYEIAG